MAVEDDLFEFFETSTSLIEVDPSGSKADSQRVIRKMILEDYYIPLIIPSALQYSAGLNSDNFRELAERADNILTELGFAVNLPDSYKVSTVMGLSLVIALRRLYNHSLPGESYYILAHTKNRRIQIYIRHLLSLYRFILYTRVEWCYLDNLDYYNKILQREKKWGYVKTAIPKRKSEIESYIREI